MLVLRPITAGQSRYYTEGPAPGRWVGAGSQDLGLEEPAPDGSLPAVLAGRRPGGEMLLERVSARRRSGFDLIFSAPKSVSLLTALGGQEHRTKFHQAHEEAVAAALGYLDREAAWTRRGREGRRIPTSGLVALAFAHSKSGALDPHLHTHVVVANLVHGDDARWSCLDSLSLYRHAGAAGALFQAALRHHLAEQGLRFDWNSNRHGLADIVGVSRAAIDAASLRHREVTDEIAAGMAGRVGRATAAGRSRSAADRSPAGTHGDEAWRPRVAAAGLDHQAAARLLAVASTRQVLSTGGPAHGPDPATLARRVGEQHSKFRRPDVVRAAAVLAINGAPVAALEAAADDFLKSAVPAAGDAWTTVDLQRLEKRIVVAAAAPPRRPGPPVGLTGPDTPPPEGLSDAGRQAFERLTRGGAPIDLLGGDLIGQAAVLDSARGAWEASGHRVAVISPTERGQARWRALAALEPLPPAPGHATIVVVDNADRWSTCDLDRVTADGRARMAKVVLLDGGTSPRRRQAESPALEALRQALPAIDAGPAPRTQLPIDAQLRHHPVVAAGRDGTVIVAWSGRAAMDEMVSDWHRRRVAGEQPRMVALGPEEAEHLNAMARALRIRAGELPGPSIEIGGRSFGAGDEVLALRRDSRLGNVAGGTVGRVTAVDPEHQAATIRWDGRTEAVTVAPSGDGTRPGRTPSVPLAHAYATTPPYLRRRPEGPLLSLGNVQAVVPRLQPDRVYDVAPAPRTESLRRQRDPVASLPGSLGPLGQPGLPADRPPPVLPSDIGRTLSELDTERDRLTEQLRAGAAPDPGPELRRVNEERDSLLSIPDRLRRPDQEVALTMLESRRITLDSAARDRNQWLAEHVGGIERWAGLTHAIAWRQTALGRGAEVRPPNAVTTAIGPPPDDVHDRAAWRRAAEAIEAHRERWGLPDRALTLTPDSTHPPDPIRRAGELKILAASQQVRRTRDRGQDRSLSPTGL